MLITATPAASIIIDTCDECSKHGETYTVTDATGTFPVCYTCGHLHFHSQMPARRARPGLSARVAPLRNRLAIA